MKISLNQGFISILIIATLAAAPAVAGNPVATFGDDAAFLQDNTNAIILRRGDAAIVVVPEYQGRVMTATAGGNNGLSSGWMNYEIIERGILRPSQEKGKLEEHMYAFGGEERFWMGPEGGQYAIFFAPGKNFEFSDWFTPDPIDTDMWDVTSKSRTQVELQHTFELLNHSGTEFKVQADRKVSLLNKTQIAKLLKGDIPEGISCVAYLTDNKVTNRGPKAWTKESGLLSIWLLCMFQPSPTTTVFIPYVEGSESDLGPIVNADYFGRVPPGRLQVEDGLVHFKADGSSRGKIGLSPQRSKGIAASYDPVAQRLTLLLFEQPKEYPGYVNSMWELQDEPYNGDAINSYNDGPVDASGEQMGPFYELESSSPAQVQALPMCKPYFIFTVTRMICRPSWTGWSMRILKRSANY
jgi:hypothetical protein